MRNIGAVSELLDLQAAWDDEFEELVCLLVCSSVKNDHSPSLNNPQPLHFAPKCPKLDILESAEIKFLTKKQF